MLCAFVWKSQVENRVYSSREREINQDGKGGVGGSFLLMKGGGFSSLVVV